MALGEQEAAPGFQRAWLAGLSAHLIMRFEMLELLYLFLSASATGL